MLFAREEVEHEFHKALLLHGKEIPCMEPLIIRCTPLLAHWAHVLPCDVGVHCLEIRHRNDKVFCMWGVQIIHVLHTRDNILGVFQWALQWIIHISHRRRIAPKMLSNSEVAVVPHLKRSTMGRDGRQLCARRNMPLCVLAKR